MPVLPSTHLTRHHTGWGSLGSQSLPTVDGVGPVAGFLLRLHVGVQQPGRRQRDRGRGQGGGPQQDAQARPLQVHAGGPGGPPAPGGGPPSRGQGQPLAMRASPRCPGTARAAFPAVSSGIRACARTSPSTARPEARSQRCFGVKKWENSAPERCPSRYLSTWAVTLASSRSGRPLLPHPPAQPSAWTGRPGVPSLDTSALVDAWYQRARLGSEHLSWSRVPACMPSGSNTNPGQRSQRYASGRNTSILVDVRSQPPAPPEPCLLKQKPVPHSVPWKASLALTSSFPEASPPAGTR